MSASPQIFDHFMVQYVVGRDKALPDGDFIGEPDLVSLKIGYHAAGFSADQHTGRSVGHPQGATEIDEAIDPPATDIA